MHDEIVLIYAMLTELMEIKDYDSCIVLDKELEDIHETIPSETLAEAIPEWNEETDEQTDTDSSVKERELAKIAEVEKKEKEIEEKLENGLSQKDMNLCSFELYTIWDDEINDLWAVLKENLNEEEMDSLLAEQLDWINYKESEMELAGAEYEGGTMAPMEKNCVGAELTKKRVFELVEKLP